MIYHLVLGFSNCNLSTEAHWRNLKDSFGEAGKREMGCSLIHFQGNLMVWTKDNSKKLYACTVDQQWLLFNAGGNNTIAMYKNLLEFAKLYFEQLNNMMVMLMSSRI